MLPTDASAHPDAVQPALGWKDARSRRLKKDYHDWQKEQSGSSFLVPGIRLLSSGLFLSTRVLILIMTKPNTLPHAIYKRVDKKFKVSKHV